MVQCANGWYRDPNNINQCCQCMVCPVGDDKEGTIVDECAAYVDSERRRGAPDVEFRFCHSPTGNCEMQPRLTTTTRPLVKKTASTTMITTLTGSTKNTVLSLDHSTSDEVPMLMLIVAIAIIVVLGFSLLLVCRRRKLLCCQQKPSPQLPGAKSTMQQSSRNLPEVVVGQLEYIDESSSVIPAVSTRTDMLASDCKVTSENLSAAVTETTYLKNSSAGGLSSSSSNFESSNQVEELRQRQEDVTSSQTKPDGDDDKKSSIIYFHHHEELEAHQQPDGDQASRPCEEERRLLEKRSDDERAVEDKPSPSRNYEDTTCSYKNQAAPTMSVKSLSPAACHTKQQQHDSSNSDNQCKLEMSNFNALYIRGTREGFLIQQATNPPPPPPSSAQHQSQPSFNSTSAATRQQEGILFTTDVSDESDVDSTPVQSTQDDGDNDDDEEKEVLKSTIPLLVDDSRYDSAIGTGGKGDRRLKFDMLKKSSLAKNREAETTSVTADE